MSEFDAIVVGSGITGGWAAKELTERGLKVLMIERGPDVKHGEYEKEWIEPWNLPFRGYGDPDLLRRTKKIQSAARLNEWNMDYFVDDELEVYDTPTESNFQWIRGYQTGGRSLVWGRQTYRMAASYFEANRQDGHGVDWPIRYEDIAPWYDYVEEFIGVNGSKENLATAPDGQFQPAMGFNAGEQKLADAIKAQYPDRRLIPGRGANLTKGIGSRAQCQYRNWCSRGCSFGAYFSTQSSTLPAAMATNRLTLLNDSIVERIDYDQARMRATGVRVINARTGEKSAHTARIIFLCAGSVNSVSVLLRSTSEKMPQGLGNSSDKLGRYFMDHAYRVGATTTIPGIDNQMYIGRKPNQVCIPRFVNLGDEKTDFLRGYSYSGYAKRLNWSRGGMASGIGEGLKQDIRKPGPWQINLQAAIETLPRESNRITLNTARSDRHGLPLTRIDLRYSENERKAAKHAHAELLKMFALLGGEITQSNTELAPPGTSIHEMGGACMGHDPRLSVTNAHNQLHDAPNIFVTDGSAMCSTGDRNPSLTYMALTVRAAASAVSMLKNGKL
ncbi:GMC oxidoreductase [Novosphingobium mathurense]|uniref:Choline dehydrogenase n=1 Tax=Novosphingobium mathurense TaxID=428990 RepID=A0A1U6IXQ5_9SPHN|nr:GMC family oxidoreductase [Novosphingobium mathurense]SLK12786.1 Choline dehydrogenase [Novosphingobium mathurense]